MSEKNLYLNAGLILPDGILPWPDALPRALYGTLVSTARDNRVITNMAVGAPRLRRGSRPLVDWVGDFKMTSAQRKIFNDFYDRDLKGGVLGTVLSVTDERERGYSYVKIMSVGAWQPIDSAKFLVQISFVEVGRP